MLADNLEIVTDDGFKICGTLEYQNSDDNKLAIFSHGFISDTNNHLIYNAAPFLHQRGIATFSFDYYSNQQGTRPFLKSSLTTHIKDLERVVLELKNKYEDIYLIGHSLGALITLAINPEHIKAIALWDPVSDVGNIVKGMEFVPSLDAFLFKNRVDVLIPKDMVDDFLKYKSITEFIKNNPVPIKTILAGNKYSQKTLELLNEDNSNYDRETDVVREANHSFDNREAERNLFEKTFAWIEKY